MVASQPACAALKLRPPSALTISMTVWAATSLTWRLLRLARAQEEGNDGVVFVVSLKNGDFPLPG